MNDHSQDDHHPCVEQSQFISTSRDACICGAVSSDAIHHAPPCEWCTDQPELGPPAPWWHRAWCRFIVWLFRPTQEMKTKKEKP